MVLLTLSGGLLLLLDQERLNRYLPYLVALAIGSLLGSGLLKMIPAATEETNPHRAMAYVIAGFLVFLALDFYLKSRESHIASQVPMILIGDGFHNLIGGISVGSAFLIDPTFGAAIFLAAVLHEIPQEVGDFAILIDGGLSAKKALVVNLLSGLPFPAGLLLASLIKDDSFLPAAIGLGAGNFLYLATVALMPAAFKNASGATRVLITIFILIGVLIQAFIPHSD